ncbi:hypothetical protein M3Y98_01087900 [Aphelenchoides besseyi]|nr:hypothetical protein M3Y98_01087900 [Aphelenchoides besseyi]KAI6209445.1 hypothetical protein M3Y96_00222200 [Aphelenchoides besseyi]
MAAPVVSVNAATAPALPTAAPTAAAPANANSAPLGQYPMASLYVGDLHPGVTESMLYNKFAAAGPVLSIRVCRDAITRRSLGYAYVNFQQPADAERALDTMNFDLMNNKPIRIMWSQRDPTVRRSGAGNIFIKNLDANIDTKSIYDTFSMFGSILSCKIACDEEGKSKGYGFIHFETEEAAQKAIDKVNGMLLDNKVVFVGKFQPRAARLREMGEAAHRFTNVYVKNFGDRLDDQKLRTLFEKYGPITSCIVMKDHEGKSRGFGFVAFERPEDAERAVNEMNNHEVDSDTKLVVCRAQKKAEREAELSRVYEQLKAERMQRYQGVNLYVKNLDDSVDSEELRRNFEQHGAIASAKVMLDDSGRSKGFGFVCFEKPDDATKAVVEMNNRMLACKPLYVALAQRKEDRKAQLASQYMQRMATMRMQGAGGMPAVYAPANTGFYMQQATMPNQRGPFVPTNSIQQMRGPGMNRWNGMSNVQYGGAQGYMVQPNQFGGHRAPRQQGGMRPQNQFQGNRAQNRGPSALGGGAGPQMRQQQMAQQGKPVQQQGPHSNYYQVGQQGRPGIPQQQNTGVPVQQEDLTSKLASAAPQEQKQILGEHLYPRISQLCKEDMVGKITGMMLEMDNSELLMLLDNSELLQERVQEAANVLQSSKPTAEMETEQVDPINQRTIAFLQTASSLSNVRNLTADLRITAKNYGDLGRTLNSKVRSCEKCAMRFFRSISLHCRFCNHRMIRSFLPLFDSRRKSNDQLIDETKNPDVKSEKRHLIADEKIKTKSKHLTNKLSSSATLQSSSTNQRNKKGRANTLRKLAALASDESMGGSSASGLSLLTFMNSLKR